MMHEQACCCDEAANHQLSRAAASWIIRIVSVEECSSLTQNVMQMHCSTRSVILNAMATQCTCSLNGPLVQWSHPCSHMCIPVHSPWRPKHIDVSADCSCCINNGWTFSGQTSYGINYAMTSLAFRRSMLFSQDHKEHTCIWTNLVYYLVQWGRHCSFMHIPVHSPWLPGNIDVTQTVLIVLTMAGLFPDSPCMWLIFTAWIILIACSIAIENIGGTINVTWTRYVE